MLQETLNKLNHSNQHLAHSGGPFPKFKVIGTLTLNMTEKCSNITKYIKKGRTLTFFTCLPQCKAFFKFYLIYSWCSPTNEIKDFADRKWKLIAGKSLSLVVVQSILRMQSSDKNSSKIKMWVNHGVCPNYMCWKNSMKKIFI